MSCVRSSALARSTRCALSRHTSPCVRRTSCSRASRSPPWAAKARAVSSSTAPVWRQRPGTSARRCGDCCHVDEAAVCRDARETWSAHVDGEASALEWRAAERHIATCRGLLGLVRRDRRDHPSTARPAGRRRARPDRRRPRPRPPHPARPWRLGARRARSSSGSPRSSSPCPRSCSATRAPRPCTPRGTSGAMTVALGFGFVYCAWRPERAYGLVPVAAAMAAALGADRRARHRPRRRPRPGGVHAPAGVGRLRAGVGARRHARPATTTQPSVGGCGATGCRRASCVGAPAPPDALAARRHPRPRDRSVARRARRGAARRPASASSAPTRRCCRPSPSAGEVLPEAPDEVRLIFDEAVDLSLGEVRLLDGSGAEIGGVGKPQHPGGNAAQVAAALPDLVDGSYVVSWKVVSDDGHPIAGAFTFQVGDVNDLEPGVLATIGDGTQVPMWLEIAESAGRALLYASMAVALGGLGFLTFGRPDHGVRRVRRVATVAAFVSALAGFILIPLQAEAARSGSLGDVSAWWDLLPDPQRRGADGPLPRDGRRRRRSGVVVPPCRSRDRRPRRARRRHRLGAGRPRGERPVAGPGRGDDRAPRRRDGDLDGRARRPRAGRRARRCRRSPSRFSPVATVAMLVVVASGTIQAIRQLGRSTRSPRPPTASGCW